VTERSGRRWLQLARGILTVNGVEMGEGDGAAVEDGPAIAIKADTDAEFLLFDLG
jgi:redox-sensitive bicupin YhaK (pirin superfamily)